MDFCGCVDNGEHRGAGLPDATTPFVRSPQRPQLGTCDLTLKKEYCVGRPGYYTRTITAPDGSEAEFASVDGFVPPPLDAI